MPNPPGADRDGVCLRIGLIGAARVAPYAIIAPTQAVARTRLVAIAARDPRRAAAFAVQYGVPAVHDSYEALIADPGIDLVYIATPPALHAPIAHRAIAAGKHVLIEKPFALNSTEAAAILNHARARGVRAFEAMHALHHALFNKVRAIVASGLLGPIRRASAHFSTEITEQAGEFRWDAAQGGGALMDLGIYPLALCRRLLGEDFTIGSVIAAGAKGVDAWTVADLDFGSVATRISCSMRDPSDAWLEIGGEAGTLAVRNPVVPSLGNRLILRARDATRDQEIAGPSSWTAQLVAITATLLDGAPYILPDTDPLASMRAIDRIRDHNNWRSGVSVSSVPPLQL